MRFSVGKRTAEYLIYLLFWGMLLLSPFFGAILNGGNLSFNTENLFSFWLFLLPAAVLFVLNNNLLMPFLLYKKRGRYYLLYVLCLAVACGIVYSSSVGIEKISGGDNIGMPNPPIETVFRGGFAPPGNDVPPFDEFGVGRAEPPFPRPVGAVMPPPPEMFGNRLLFAISTPHSVQMLIIVFVLVFNICVRLSFFTLRRDKHIKELEKEKLKTELNYLKYQINPHFFMNTLNNIHALIDIDRDKAQTVVLELSKMMRYVLYDASTSLVLLEKELLFLYSYVDLMRLRYTSKVEVNMNFSGDIKGLYVPSLLLVLFVENAFKHGVTYKKESVIDIMLRVDNLAKEVVFECRNTCSGCSSEPGSGMHGGIGVENARKRLELLYGDKATLNIDNNGETYNVVLKIPVSYDKMPDNR